MQVNENLPCLELRLYFLPPDVSFLNSNLSAKTLIKYNDMNLNDKIE
jgi:hypothetical protein